MSGYVGSILAFLGAVVAAYLAYRQATAVARTQARAEARKVDAGAYERAKALYESGIQQLEEQVRRLRAEVDSYRGRAAIAEDASSRLSARVAELELTIARMRRQLILAGVEPDHDDHTGGATTDVR
jgi:chromosome segregation ATPase